MFLTLAPATTSAVAPVAAEVSRAAGVEAWNGVKVLRFTCNTGPGLEIKSRVKYEYDRANERITVSSGARTASASLRTAPENEDARWALAQWHRDSVWVLLPLRIADADLQVQRKPDVRIEEKTFQVLQVLFPAGGEASMPLDLYVDTDSHQIRTSIHTLADGKRIRHTWDFYKDISGIRFCTSHDGPGKKISLSEIEVER